MPARSRPKGDADPKTGTGQAAPPPPRKGTAGFLRGVFFVGAGTALAQVISILVTPALSRMFPPEAFGLAQVFGAFMIPLGTLACLGYHMAVLLPKEDEDASRVFALCITLLVAVTAVYALVIFLAGEAILRACGAGELMEYRWLLPPGLVIFGIAFPLQFWHIRQTRFKLGSAARVAGKAAAAATALVLGGMGFASGLYLVLANMASGLVIAFILAGSWAKHDAAFTLHHLSVSRTRQLAGRYKKFPLINAWAPLVDRGLTFVPALLMAAIFSPAAAGFYGIATRLLRLPMSLIGTSIAQVSQQRLSSAVAHGQDISELVESTCRRLAMVALMPMAVIALAGPELFELVLGAPWRTAGVYAALVTMQLFFRFLTTPMASVFIALERQGTQMALSLLLLAGIVAGLAIGGHVTGSPLQAVVYSSAAGAVMYILRGVIILRLARARVRVLASQILLQILIAVPGLAAIALTKWLLKAGSLSVTGVAVLAVLLYFAASLRQDRELRRKLFGLLPRRVRRRPGESPDETDRS